MLQAGQKVIKVIEGGGSRTASFQRVARDDGAVITLVGSSTEYDSVSRDEIDPPIPGFGSFLVMFDADQEERVRYDDDQP